MRYGAGALGVVLGAGLLCGAGRAQAPVYGADVAGHAVALGAPAGARAVVLIFIATDCPISNRYQPEIRRLEREFAEQGVAFRLVYPNLTETEDAIRAHQAAYAAGSRTEILTDPHQELARMTGAKVTPEAAVLVPGREGLETVYAGRIDDRYLRIGSERPRANRHDLEEAIAAVLAGRPVPAPGGPPVGCGIVSTR